MKLYKLIFELPVCRRRVLACYLFLENICVFRDVCFERHCKEVHWKLVSTLLALGELATLEDE